MLCYDAATGVPFARYASTRIKGAMLDELRSLDWASRGARARSRELVQADDVLTGRLGRVPTTAELAAELRVEVGELDRRRAESERSLLSLDAYDSVLADSLPDSAPDPAERLLADERVGYLRAALAALPERLRAVATGVYLEQRPMAELAAELGVTESRVSQLRAEALELLRDGINSQLDPQRLPQHQRPGGAVARRRESLYAAVAANAAAAGLGCRAALPATTPAPTPAATPAARTAYSRSA